MKAVEFKECNTTFAENQDEYKSLPAFYEGKNGVVVSCYKLSIKEVLRIIFKRRIWVGIMTFGNGLQPQLITTDKNDLITEN
jgi:hypothetical protein